MIVGGSWPGHRCETGGAPYQWPRVKRPFYGRFSPKTKKPHLRGAFRSDSLARVSNYYYFFLAAFLAGAFFAAFLVAFFIDPFSLTSKFTIKIDRVCDPGIKGFSSNVKKKMLFVFAPPAGPKLKKRKRLQLFQRPHAYSSPYRVQ